MLHAGERQPSMTFMLIIRSFTQNFTQSFCASTKRDNSIKHIIWFTYVLRYYFCMTVLVFSLRYNANDSDGFSNEEGKLYYMVIVFIYLAEVQ